MSRQIGGDRFELKLNAALGKLLPKPFVYTYPPPTIAPRAVKQTPHAVADIQPDALAAGPSCWWCHREVIGVAVHWRGVHQRNVRSVGAHPVDSERL